MTFQFPVPTEAEVRLLLSRARAAQGEERARLRRAWHKAHALASSGQASVTCEIEGIDHPCTQPASHVLVKSTCEGMPADVPMCPYHFALWESDGEVFEVLEGSWWEQRGIDLSKMTTNRDLEKREAG